MQVQMNPLLVLMMMGTYCGSNKPYIQDMVVTFRTQYFVQNNTMLDATVKMPLDKITCINQLYNMTPNGEIMLLDDCVEKNLKKHHVELSGVYYNEEDNDIIIKTNVGDMKLPFCAMNMS
jgi:hypothetical protein